MNKFEIKITNIENGKSIVIDDDVEDRKSFQDLSVLGTLIEVTKKTLE